MTNLKLNWSGAQVYDVYPKTLPALFKGTTQVVFGRLKGATSSTRLNLKGVVNSKPVTIEGSIVGGDGNENESIPRLWATRKVGFLLDDSRRKGVEPGGEVRDEIIALSKKFGIVTPLTAALITEDDAPRVINGAVPNAPLMRRSGSANSIDGAASSDTSVTYGAYNSTSGESAVRAAKSTATMKSSTREEKNRADIRNVAGKTFVLRDGVWTDSLFDATKKFATETVKFASPRYFALAKDTKIAKWLSVGQRVIVVIENRNVVIQP